MNFTLYSADCIGQTGNCLYPHKFDVTDEAAFAQAVSHDYVCAEYMNHYRSGDNFLGSDCLPVDCDNDHSENPEDWVAPDDIRDAFPDVSFAVHYSRSHMREKNGKVPRPKFHVLFPIEYMTDTDAYSDLKKLVNAIFPYFDTNALDAARFFFGTANPEVELYPGDMTLTEFLSADDFDAELPEGMHGGSTVIPEGSRNATMSRFAGRVIKKYGDSETAYQCFIEEAEKCRPHLEQAELQNIWHSAQKFYAKVKRQEGYIPPEEYNRDNSLCPFDFSDIGQAKVLARKYAAEIVYTDATDYMRYDGTHWAESKQMAVGACEEFLDRQLEEAVIAVDKAKQALIDAGIGQDLISAGGKALEKTIDNNSKKAFAAYCSALAYKSFVMKRRDMKYVVSALQAAKPMLLRNIHEFDTQEFLLNTPTATYDLRLGMNGAHDHCADDLITKMTAVSPCEEGTELWLSSYQELCRLPCKKCRRRDFGMDHRRRTESPQK